MTRDTTIWQVDVGSAARRLRGTFVNPNHFALALELALAVSFALLWWGIRRARREVSPERRLALVALPALLWVTLFSGLVFSGSRAGLAGAIVATAVQGLVLAASRRRWRFAPLGLGLAAAGILLAIAIGARQEQARALSASAQDVSLHARLEAWKATLDLWLLFPVSGAGLGAFADAFPLVQPATLDGHWSHAHNDALEILALTGPPGVVLGALAVFAVARGLVRRLRAEGQRSESRAAVLAGLGALVAAGVHEMFDFGLTLPANAVTLAVICGAALAAVPNGACPTPGGEAGEPAVSSLIPSEAEGSGRGRRHRKGPATPGLLSKSAPPSCAGSTS
jgi:O-antigen ligase